MTHTVLKSYRSKMSLVYIWSQKKDKQCVTSQLLPIRQWPHDNSTLRDMMHLWYILLVPMSQRVLNNSASQERSTLVDW